MKAAGWRLQFHRVYLSAPLPAPNLSQSGKDGQAYYVYSLKEGIQVFVGTVDLKVYSLSLLEKR